MKLVNVLTLRLSAMAAIVLAFWAVWFYFAIMDEINDEVDDSLEDHAEMLIRRALAGEPLPTSGNGTNNEYYMHEVSPQYAATHSHIRYEDHEVYINAKSEFEPARTISYIYNDDQGRYYEMVVFTPTIDKDDLRRAIAYCLALLYCGILLCIVAVNIRTLRKGMRPLHTLLDWLDHYRLGADNSPLRMHTNISEFKKLGETARQNMSRNETLYEQQKLFIANSSHEIQTPLAIIQSRLEMMIDDGSLNEQQLGEVIKTLHTVKSLSRTNRSLLLLCKIDNGQFTDTATVSLSSIISQLLPELEMIYSTHSIRVQTTLHGDMTMQMNDLLATTLLSNLLKNAFTHNIDGGSVAVSLTPHKLRVANSGQPTPLDPQRIFEPFYHSPNKRSSTGLGLSIVRAICQLYGLHIEYSFEEGQHVFEISRQ